MEENSDGENWFLWQTLFNLNTAIILVLIMIENIKVILSKTTPSKPIRKSLRQNMARNRIVYNKHVKKHMKKYSYVNALKALRKGRNTNPAHTCDKDALIF